MINKLILFLALLTTKTLLAQTCVSGSSNNNNIVQQLETASRGNLLTQTINRLYKLDNSTTEAKHCAECEAYVSPRAISPIQLQSNPKAPQLLFKPECLNVSNQFNSDTAEVSCPDGKKTKSRDLCITEKYLKYQNAVISNFVSCTMKENFSGPDPAALYQMYSLETGFKPQYSYNGGVGLGQLTRVFVDDIHQKHRGQKFLKKIATSTNPECEAAKIIAEKDLKSKPSISNSCSFISIGEGMERNVLYSLVGFANSWERDIEPKLRGYLAKYPNHPLINEVKNKCLLNAYGPGGRAAARAAITRLSSLPPEQFVEAMQKPLRTTNGRNLTVYTQRMESRRREIEQQLQAPIKEQFAKTGAKACIQSY